jgi:hypothetical protein
LLDGFTSDLFNDVWGRGEVYRRFVGKKPERKRSFARPKHRGKENIRIDLKDAYLEGVCWIDLDQDRGN